MSKSPPRGSAFRPLGPPTNLADALFKRLSEEILSGNLEPGMRLPTEQEMVETFGVSRTVVREAVAGLKADGFVVTRQGVGGFVARDAGRRPFRINPDTLGSLHEVLHVMELRTSVEAEAAGLAAERASAAQIRAVGDALQRIDSAIQAGELAVTPDFEFHRAIAAATGNPYYVKFLEFLGNFIIPRQTVRLDRQSGDEQTEYLRKVQGEHRAIFKAIAAHEAAAARDATRLHLMNSRHRYRRLAEDGSLAVRAPA